MIDNNSGWQAIGNNDNQSDDYLRVKPGCNLRARLVGKPVKVVKLFSSPRTAPSLAAVLKCLPLRVRPVV